ncbi:hypothetical protein K443DRAFT_117012, partial [Laccaria amethystina LaAM-08-1]
VNGPLRMCHVVHTATTHAVLAVHSSAVTFSHCNARQPPPRHCLTLCRIGDDDATRQ